LATVSENLVERSFSNVAGGVPDLTSVGALRVARLQCEATLKTLAEVISAGHRGRSIIAMRSYAGRCLAVAIGGVVDPPMLDRIRALHDDPHLAGLAESELVLDLSQVQDSAPGLTSVLDQLRRDRTRDGCRVELRDPPPTLADELDRASLTEVFTIFDAVHGAAVAAVPRPRAGHLPPRAGG
jgi:STAS domain-containing protein